MLVLLIGFDHQNPLAHAGSTWCSTTTGSVKVNVEPWPGCDSTQILPPCISMMRTQLNWSNDLSVIARACIRAVCAVLLVIPLPRDTILQQL
jgi:hypothetical protein